MNKQQKIFVTGAIVLIIAVATASTLFNQQKSTETDKLNIVATFYPLAFFAQEIGGEQASVKQLIPDNTEVHNWQPSTQDILAVEKADVLLYNGASLDHWFEEDILSVIDLSNKIIVETTDGAQLLETGHEDETHESGHEHEGIYDPHTWISPTMAKHQAENIYQALCQKDPDNTDYYTERWQILKSKFEELDNRYRTELGSKQKNEIFVSHSAFGYLADSYGFEQHGVIGISADEQPSASTYMNLVEMMLEHETYVVYVDPVYSGQSAQTLGTELQRLSGQEVQILKLYLMLGKIDNLNYFEQQEQNLVNLKIGLDV
ncbi:MAG: zinc ABC transporter substrate-binding protein [Candidatus Bathyarchaeum tardum]|nr:MAG: zinc ABC transporter substrate-binding protein [Candidatus Bathyarchaeum tardum]